MHPSLALSRSFFAAVIVASGALAFLAGCKPKSGDTSASGGKSRTTIQNKGSDTMVNVAQVWAEDYKKLHPHVDVEVSGGGSGVGLAALTKGTIDLANAHSCSPPSSSARAAAMAATCKSAQQPSAAVAKCRSDATGRNRTRNCVASA